MAPDLFKGGEPGDEAPMTGEVTLDNKRGMRFEVLAVLCVAVLPLLYWALVDLVSPERRAANFADSGDPITQIGRALFDLSVVLLVIYLLWQRGDSFRRMGFTFGLATIPLSIVVLGAVRLFDYIAAHIVLSWLSVDIISDRMAETKALFDAQNAQLGLWALLPIVVAPVFEEIVVRSYLQTRLEALGWGAFTAAVTSALIQSAYHLYQGPDYAFLLFPGFLVLALYYAWFRGVTVLILAHFYYDLLIWVF
jgi:membrane protease YdiL (CAAX protease family)